MEAIFQMKQSDFEKFMTDLKKFVSDEVRSEKVKSVEKPISPKEAAAFLKISLKTLYNRINNSDIPAQLIHRNGGNVYFFESELEQYIKQS